MSKPINLCPCCGCQVPLVEELREALEAALFALCTVETTAECAAARYRVRAAIAKAKGEG